MSTNPAGAVLINNAYKIMPRYAQGMSYSRRRSSGVLERILMMQAAGAASDKFRLLEVRNALNEAGLRKKGKEVVMQYRVRNAYGAGAFDPHQACADAPGVSWKAKSFYLDKIVTHSVELDLNVWKCTNVPDTNFAAELLADAIEELTANFSNDVEQEIYKNHIGKLPSKIGGIGQTPRDFSQLAVFRANGVELNEAAEGEFATDLLMANIGRHVVLTAALGIRYARQKQATLVNDRGTDFTAESMQALTSAEYMHTPILAGVVNPAAYGTSGSPALVVENGSIYIASAPFYTRADQQAVPQIEDEPGKKRYSIAHPYLPGIFIDVVETVETQCDEFHQFPRVKLQMGINYTVISRMSCEVDNGDFNKGVNGVMLYFFNCADTGACDYDDYKYTPPVLSKPLDNKCETDVTCAADLACKVQPYAVGFQQVGDTTFAVFAASVKPSGGANNPASYQWLLNGAPFQSTGVPTLLVDITDLSNSDVISLVYEDSADCAQTVEFAPIDLENQGVCGTLIVAYDGAELQANDVLALGNLPQTGAGIGTPLVFNLGAANFALAINAGVVGSANSAALSTSTLAIGANTGTYTVQLKTEALGAGNAEITFVTCAGDFKVNVTFTVV